MESVPEIYKTLMFVLIGGFVFYMPLGEPDYLKDFNVAVCYLSDFYDILLKLAQRTVKLVHYLVCIVLDLLYEGKFLAYSVLEKIDGDDLCRTVCCGAGEPADGVLVQSDSRVSCTCVKKKCCRRRPCSAAT